MNIHGTSILIVFQKMLIISVSVKCRIHSKIYCCRAQNEVLSISE